jgi:pyruvate/2-oxoglutarate dehydrogenase complex dihydrolipoamide acyltransferase (E2) component
MQIPILLPELSATPVILSCWFADQGETVFEGDRILEILVEEGATFDVAAPATGRLVEKSAYARDHLRPGQVLGIVEGESESQ